MDDHRCSWSWCRPTDDKYCSVLPPEPNDGDPCEPYVDSLRQLNKIVERILPEKSPLSLVSVRPRLDVPALLKRPFLGHKESSSARDFQHWKPATSLTCSAVEMPADSPAKQPPLSLLSGVVGLEDSLRLKALRPSDSLNDSAYETYCGDASSDAIDSVEKSGRADELGSGNDAAEYGASSPRSKFEDDRLCAGDKEAGVGIRGFMADIGGDRIIGKSLIVECDRMRCKSLESEISTETDGAEQIKQDGHSGTFLLGSLSKQSPSAVAERDLSDNCQNGSYRRNLFPSSAAGQLTELERLVAEDKCSNMQVSSSLRATNLGSKLSGSSMSDTDRPLGRGAEPLPEGGDEELKSFSCPHCAYSASKKGQVRKHLSVHSIFLCAHCEFGCDRADLLEEHRRTHHPGLCGRRLCKKCRVLFQSSELEAHERQCSGEKQRWACHVCAKEFKFLSVMKAHAHKWHPAADDDAPKTVEMSSDAAGSKPCSVSSGTPSVTSTATQPDGRNPKQFQCTECGKMFKTKWTLSNHALTHAGTDSPFCCDVDGCSGVTFRSDKELNCHRMAVHHLGPTKYECLHPGCTMQFAKYGHFKRHQLTHAGLLSFLLCIANPDTYKIAFGTTLSCILIGVTRTIISSISAITISDY